jgi:hypothetical protein
VTLRSARSGISKTLLKDASDKRTRDPRSMFFEASVRTALADAGSQMGHP